MTYRTLKSLAKNLEFTSEAEAAEYIYTSRINGNHSQARQLFRGLSRSEQSEAMHILTNDLGISPAELLDCVEDWRR